MAIITGLVGAGLGAAAAGAGILGAGVTAGTAALAAGSIGLAAGSSYMQAQNQKQQAAFARDTALTNAQISRDNARDVELRGRIAVFNQRRAVARELAGVRAATAGAGLVVDEAGTTPQDMVNEMAARGELDVMTLKSNIEREERRALVQGAAFEAQAGQFEAGRSSINPFRSAIVAGAGTATSGRNADILFGT